MRKTAVVNVVGLTPALLHRDMPNLAKWASGGRSAAIRTSVPAVTCTVQANMLTGKRPAEHGIVGNGWYARDDAEVRFWKQSNHLVQAEKIWEAAKRENRAFTCANLFWWFNMYSSAEFSVTPRPMYPADGRKLPDVYSKPPALRADLQRRFGTFPLFQFWGPGASIRSSAWIADAAIHVDQEYDPVLSLIYLPHLDYALQRLGPEHREVSKHLHEVDHEVGRLIAHFERAGAEVLVVSEYGITPAWKPIDINRHLRREGLLAFREEMGREYLDAGASTAFAVADHQVAHVYINDPGQREQVRALLATIDGVGEILDEAGKQREGLNHSRSGDLVLIAKAGAWFTYYYWEDDTRAPDYARTVDIHRKPGYDPVELFMDPDIRFPRLKVGRVLVKKALGFRTLMDVVPLDAALVRGTHGRRTEQVEESPVFITQGHALARGTKWIADTDVFDLIQATVFERRGSKVAA